MSNRDKFDISRPPLDPRTVKLLFDICVDQIDKELKRNQSEAEKTIYSRAFDDKFKVGDKTIEDQLDLFCKPFKRNKID